MRLGYGVFEGTYAFDGDLDVVTVGQGEVVRWDDTGAGHEEDAAGEGSFTEEVGRQLLGVAFEFGKGGGAGEGFAVGGIHATSSEAGQPEGAPRESPIVWGGCGARCSLSEEALSSAGTATGL